MVIVCPECTTKFRVNPERIPASGAKVRCARCKHIFLAEKPAAEEELQTNRVEAVAPAEEAEQPVVAEATSPTEAVSAASDPLEESLDTVDSSNGFSYDQFRDLDATKTDGEDFSFGDKDKIGETSPASVAAIAATADLPEESKEEDSFSFSGPADVPADSAESMTDESFAAIASPPVEEPAGEPNPEEGSAADAALPTPTESPRKSSSTTSFTRIFLLLILGLLVVAGTLYYINGPEQIEQVIKQIFGQQQLQSGQADRIALTNLEGKFIKNQEAGELFVIRGEATNNFSEARASIQVKGVIFDQNGKALLQKTIFCGNPISDQELQTLSFNKLEEMMGNQFGKSLKNMNINSKQAIPFVIAFRNLPKSLSEFSVDVTSSEPAAQ